MLPPATRTGIADLRTRWQIDEDARILHRVQTQPCCRLRLYGCGLRVVLPGDFSAEVDGFKWFAATLELHYCCARFDQEDIADLCALLTQILF